MVTVQYQDEADDLMLDVKFDGDTTWLSEDEIALLFDTSRSNVGQHIKSIYDDEELEKSTTLKKILKVGDNHPRPASTQEAKAQRPKSRKTRYLVYKATSS